MYFIAYFICSIAKLLLVIVILFLKMRKPALKVKKVDITQLVSGRAMIQSWDC